MFQHIVRRKLGMFLKGMRMRRYAASFRLVAGLLAAVSVSGCALAGPGKGLRSHAPADVVGKIWQWESWTSPVETFDVATPERYTLQLMPDGSVHARFDCNRGGGPYTIGEGRLAFGPLRSTRMACPPDTLGNRFSAELARVTSFFLEDGTLYLELPVDSGTMRFGAARDVGR
jgi:heat shock protein HslJ